VEKGKLYIPKVVFRPGTGLRTAFPGMSGPGGGGIFFSAKNLIFSAGGVK
jgi:hypothetical protein